MPTMPPPLTARYFDGRQSTAHPVCLSADQQQLTVRGEGVAFACPWAQVVIGEALGDAPRRLELGEYGHCEVAATGLDAWLAAHGQRSAGWLAWAQGHWQGALGALGLVLAVVSALYLWGLPALSAWLAPRLPDRFTTAISQQAMQVLDQHLLQASQLPLARQQAIAARLAPLLQAGDPAYRLLFRHTGQRPNAFALPDGTVVVFDELAALVDDDEQLAAVLLHELGHVAHRHGLRQFIQSSLVGVATGLYFGDVSTLAGSFAAMLGSARYSREFEQEADRFAAQRLLAKGRSPALLAAALQQLQQAEAGTATAPGGGLPALLHSHPAPQARIQALRQPQ